MKTGTLLSFAAAIALSACQFNQSVNKDLNTGAYSRGDGLGCDEVIIMINGEAVKRNDFVFGDKINFYFRNMEGFDRRDGMAYPGMTLDLVENESDTIYSEPDMLKDFNDGIELSPLQIQAAFNAVIEDSEGHNYKAYIHIWDKKGTGTFDYELPFTVAPEAEI